jgi:hypothetical protein
MEYFTGVCLEQVEGIHSVIEHLTEAGLSISLKV